MINANLRDDIIEFVTSGKGFEKKVKPDIDLLINKILKKYEGDFVKYNREDISADMMVKVLTELKKKEVNKIKSPENWLFIVLKNNFLYQVQQFTTRKKHQDRITNFYNNNYNKIYIEDEISI